MIHNSDIYYKCPSCGAYLYTHSFASGNTFRAEHYSDGKMIAPMLPKYPNLTKCEECGAIVMLSRLDRVAEDDLEYTQKGWGIRLWERLRQKVERQVIKRSYECRPLEIRDLYKALDIFPEDELYIRLKIWRDYNDVFRNFHSGINPIDTAEYRNNCYALLKILNKDNREERLLSVEINRNLGNFTECLNLISRSRPRSEWEDLIEKIFVLECEIGNRCTVRIDNYFKKKEEMAKYEAERKERERIREEMKDPRWKVCPNGHCYENIRKECIWCGETNVVSRMDKDVRLQHKELYVGKQNGKYILTFDSTISMQEERIRKITVDYYQDKFIYFHLDGKNPNPFHINNIQLDGGYINGCILTRLCEYIVKGKNDSFDLSSFIDRDVDIEQVRRFVECEK